MLYAIQRRTIQDDQMDKYQKCYDTYMRKISDNYYVSIYYTIGVMNVTICVIDLNTNEGYEVEDTQDIGYPIDIIIQDNYAIIYFEMHSEKYHVHDRNIYMLNLLHREPINFLARVEDNVPYYGISDKNITNLGGFYDNIVYVMGSEKIIGFNLDGKIVINYNIHNGVSPLLKINNNIYYRSEIDETSTEIISLDSNDVLFEMVEGITFTTVIRDKIIYGVQRWNGRLEEELHYMDLNANDEIINLIDDDNNHVELMNHFVQNVVGITNSQNGISIWIDIEWIDGVIEFLIPFTQRKSARSYFT